MGSRPLLQSRTRAPHQPGGPPSAPVTDTVVLQQLLVDAVGAPVHLPDLGALTALENTLAVVERRRRDRLLFHGVDLRIAGDRHLALREAGVRFCPRRAPEGSEGQR